MTELSIVMMWIEKIIPYAFNNKNHSDDQIDKIAQSLSEFWFRKPIEIDEKNVLIAWHARREAAKKLWMKKVPVIVHSDLSEIQKKKYRILDNRLADLSTYNIENLKLELSELNDVDLSAMFDGIDLWEDLSLKDTINWEWSWMPEFAHDDLASEYSIIVHFDTKVAIYEFAKIIWQNLTEKTKSIWFPFKENEVLKDKRY